MSCNSVFSSWTGGFWVQLTAKHQQSRNIATVMLITKMFYRLYPCFLSSVSRLHCESESFKMDLILDVNIQIYPVDLGKIFNFPMVNIAHLPILEFSALKHIEIVLFWQVTQLLSYIHSKSTVLWFGISCFAFFKQKQKTVYSFKVTSLDWLLRARCMKMGRQMTESTILRMTDLPGKTFSFNMMMYLTWNKQVVMYKFI